MVSGRVRVWVANCLVIGLCLAAIPVLAVGQESQKKESRWESQIRAFEAKDQKQAPPQGGIVFVGSSSIRLWNLPKSFPDLPVTNRGFGGSQLADSVQFAERIVLPYRPKVVVVYAGDNDLASGKSPEQVAADFRALVEKVRKALPKTRVVYIAIKPSLARWKLIETIRKANDLISESSKKDSRVILVDVEKEMLGADGRPRPELFKPDGLHLNDEGYAVWARLVRPHLKLE